MKLIIAGGRDINLSIGDFDEYFYRFEFDLENTEIVSGCAKGVDTSGEYYAKECSLLVHRFPADWNKHKRAAGPIRNLEMAEFADALLLIWDGKSKGSANMKQTMLKLNKPIYEVIINNEKTTE